MVTSPSIPGVTFDGLARTWDPTIEYDYPGGLDWHPDSALHRQVLTKLVAMAQDSSAVMSGNYDDWERLEKVVSAYLYEPTRAKKEGKSTRALENVEVVLPVSYAQLETLLTYMVAAFFKDPIFPYEGTGPEDAYGALMLERVIHRQALKARIGLNFHTQWRDNFIYGFGAVQPYWDRTFGTQTQAVNEEIFDASTGEFVPTGNRVRKRVRDVLKFEGNKIDNIDPYGFLPDPRVAVSDIQKAEYCGWVVQDTVSNLRFQEDLRDSGYFNVQYLDPQVQHVSSLATAKRLRKKAVRRESPNAVSKVADVLWVYVYLIPDQWDLGSSQKQELWLFGVVGDKLIVFAEPVDEDHGELPVVVCATNTDGYSATPQSQIGTILGLQEIADFMYNSHIINVRKAINDMFVFDPQLINVKDLQNPAPGKLIRLRRQSWGKNILDQAIKQLEVNDVTGGNLQEVLYILDLAGQTTGGSSMIKGAFQPRTSRVSAREAGNLQQNSFSRLEMVAQLIDLQSMSRLSYIFASNAIQHMEKETYVKVVGELAQRIADDFPNANERVDGKRLRISPLELVVDYDVQPHDGKIPGSQNPQDWVQVLQLAGQVPGIVEVLNWPALFKHIARILGVTNVDDFINSGARVRIAPDDVVAREAQAGNITPVAPPSTNSNTPTL